MKKSSIRTTSAIHIALFAVLIAAQCAAEGTNSRVRFRFFRGTTVVGDVNVELFDIEKPATVRNFLRYVREGAYDNLILQRCIPNFVIQAGEARSINPQSTSEFNGYLPTVLHDPLTNEFATNSRIPNDFGTLAMAKVDGHPDSATSDWFFNLTNNSQTLDVENGGFTVFGRITSGSNVLAFFNQTNRLLGISKLYSEPFADLPVAYNPTQGRYPRFSELYHVQVTSLDQIADTTRPTLKIVSPQAGLKLTNGVVIVRGTASDNAAVRMVWVSLNNGTQTNADGTNIWSTTVSLNPGTNRVWAQSVDMGGRRSSLVSRLLYWFVPWPIGVYKAGSGTILGPTNEQMLEIGRIYALSANPALRHKFLKWDLSLDGNSYSHWTNRVMFYMTSNMTWTATFVTNPFPPLAGQYVGTAFHSNDLANELSHWRLPDSLCAFTLNLTDQGSFSGKLRQGKSAYPFSGGFRPDGRAEILIARTGLQPLTLTVTNRNAQLTGSVTDFSTWFAWLHGERASTGTSAKPSRWSGRYTLALPGGTNSALQPPGNGPATATVSSSGMLSLTGNLPDGTPLTFSTPVSTNGYWPLYVPLYGGKGGVFAWSHFDSNSPSASLEGLHVWVKRASAATKLYTNGFVITNVLAGSAYRVPTGNTNRVLDFTNGIVALYDGGLATDVTNEILLSAANRVTNLGPSQFTFALTNANGRFSGSVTPPGTTKPMSFKGVVLQNQNRGTGYFLNTNTAGGVYFGPRW